MQNCSPGSFRLDSWQGRRSTRVNRIRLLHVAQPAVDRMNANPKKPSVSWAKLLIAAVATSFWAPAGAEPALGSDRAPVTIVEYGSLTCDYCVRFHREVLPRIQSGYIETGVVRFIYRDFPTGDAATRGAVAARCADDHYYAMLDALYADVGNWSRARDIETALIQQATSLGLAPRAFRACLKGQVQRRAIEHMQRTATAEYGVLGTPTFLINGRIIRGMQDFEQMKLLIAEALANPSVTVE